jgi:predicted DNA-binding antitoxin AbrB/MazE fold protein
VETIRATYRDGVFAPEQQVDLPEGAHVTLWVKLPGEEISHLRMQDREFLDRLTHERSEVFRRLAE